MNCIPRGAYNSSIVRFNGRLLLSYRVHDRGDWRTSLFIAELGEDFKPISCKPFRPPKNLEDNSQEDARTWIHQGNLWMSWSISLYPATEYKGIVAFGNLVESETEWTVGNFYIPAHGRNDFSAVEKNFVFWSQDERLYCFYAVQNGQQTVLQLEQARVEEVFTTPALPWAYGPLHGGAICRHDGSLYHFFNSRDKAGRYSIGCATMEGHPPFAMKSISPKPILRGEEGVCLDKQARPKNHVVFACGAIRENGQFLLAHGWNDCQCRILKL